jgi:hypothetical protein
MNTLPALLAALLSLLLLSLPAPAHGALPGRPFPLRIFLLTRLASETVPFQEESQVVCPAADEAGCLGGWARLGHAVAAFRWVVAVAVVVVTVAVMTVVAVVAVAVIVGAVAVGTVTVAVMVVGGFDFLSQWVAVSGGSGSGGGGGSGGDGGGSDSGSGSCGGGGGGGGGSVGSVRLAAGCCRSCSGLDERGVVSLENRPSSCTSCFFFFFFFFFF